MKLIFKCTSFETGHEMLHLLSSILLQFECLANDLEREFANDMLTRKIGEGPYGRDGYSIRDRFGQVIDEMLLASLAIAKNVGIDEHEFREAIDEVIGDSRIFDGQYDRYTHPGPLGPLESPKGTWWDNAPVAEPSEELLTLEKGRKRWWKPSEKKQDDEHRPRGKTGNGKRF